MADMGRLLKDSRVSRMELEGTFTNSDSSQRRKDKGQPVWAPCTSPRNPDTKQMEEDTPPTPLHTQGEDK